MIREFIKTKYFKASSLYVAMSLAPSALNFLLLPLYLRYISVSDYGYLKLINIYVVIFIIFSCFQVNIYGSAKYFAKEVNKDLLRTGVMLTAIVGSLFFFGVFTLLGEPAFSFFKNDIGFFPLGFMLLGAGMLGQIQSVLFVFLKNEYHVRELGMFSFAFIIINILSQVILIVWLDMGLMGIILGRLIARLAVVPVLLIVYRRWILALGWRSFVSKKVWLYVLEGLKFGIPFIPSVFLQRAQNFSDRLILERHLPLENVGQYAFLITLLGLPHLVAYAILNAVRPKVMVLLEENEIQKTNRMETFYFGLVAVFFLFTLLLGANLQLFTDNPQYLEIRQYLYAGILAALPGSMMHFSHLRLMHASKTGMISRFSLIAFIAQLILLLILIPKIGINGAIVAMAVSGLLNYALSLKAAHYLSQTTLRFEPFLLPVILLILIGVGMLLTYSGVSFMAVSWGIFAIGIVLMSLLLSRKLGTIMHILKTGDG